MNIIRANFPADWSKIAVYGEWAGAGIQKNVAVSMLPKAFYIFAARLISENEENEEWLDVRNWVLPVGVFMATNAWLLSNKTIAEHTRKTQFA